MLTLFSCVHILHYYYCYYHYYPHAFLKKSEGDIVIASIHSSVRVCVFSQMKDTKHIRRDIHSVAWVMPKGWDCGVLGCPGVKKVFFFKSGHVTYQIYGDDKQNRMHVKFSS